MKVSTEIDNNFGYEKITQLVDNIPLNHQDLAIVSLKVVSRKRRRKCTLKSYDRFTNS